MKTHFTWLFLLASLVSLGQDKSQYIKDIKAWHQDRVESLKSENGWLNLAGLFWLEEGENSFGSDASNQIVFPEKAPKKLGTLLLKDSKVSFVAEQGVAVSLLGPTVPAPYVFADGQSTTMQYGSLRWFVIKRGPKVGIRLRDLESVELQHFKGVDTYPIDAKWKVTAKLEKATADKKIAIMDVLGQTTMQPSPGTLVFSIAGKEYRLDAVESEGELFILYADPTNQKETYGAGRFLYADLPNEQGTTILDFNKSINPPCAFTAFATCPLPPKQNRLPIAIRAGEKNYGLH